MKVKTSELIGVALDYAIMKCEIPQNSFKSFVTRWPRFFDYSTNWQKGGPIIEREEIGTKRNASCSDGRQWEAKPSITAKGAGGKYGYGPTPLIAAMRCYVASKLGEEIDLHKLIKGD